MLAPVHCPTNAPSAEQPRTCVLILPQVIARLRQGYMFLERAVELEGGAGEGGSQAGGDAPRLSPQQMEQSLERLFEGGWPWGACAGRALFLMTCPELARAAMQPASLPPAHPQPTIAGEAPHSTLNIHPLMLPPCLTTTPLLTPHS